MYANGLAPTPDNVCLTYIFFYEAPEINHNVRVSSLRLAPERLFWHHPHSVAYVTRLKDGWGSLGSTRNVYNLIR